MRSIAAHLLLVLGACPSGTSAPVTPVAPAGGSGSATPVAAAEQPPGEAECAALIEHAIELDARPRGAAGAPSDAERAQLRGQLAPYAEACRAMPRADFRCAMAATTSAQLAACQDTRRSSTSNSSVAPGGITPAAPRSP